MICKCWNIGYKTIYDASFILTMWYVNKLTFNEAQMKSLGFILTMWYVNVHQHTATSLHLLLVLY